MDHLNTSYLALDKYPENLILPNRYEGQLKEYRQKLECDAERLFCNDGNAKVFVLQLEEGKDAFESCEVTTDDAMGDVLRMKNRCGSRDPICRFVFFHATSSRGKLFTTQKMFAEVLTCHQIMPEFLDFVFPFGKREHAEDFHFGALKIENRSGIPPTALNIPKFGRSGRQYQLCYNLRCVEPYKDDPEWPWSIRQCAVFHSFDVENGRTVWVTMKGNLRIRNRIAEATKSEKLETSSIRSYNSVSASFASSLNVHLNLSDMATDYWRWYINFLEEKFQKLTRYALHTPVDDVPMAETVMPAPLRSNTAPPQRVPRRWSIASAPKWLARSHRSRTMGSAGVNNPETDNILLENQNANPNKKIVDDPGFSFGKLQSIQYLEEKANETLLVVEMNCNILQELSEYYTDLHHRSIWPDNFEDETGEALTQFQRAISSSISDLKMQRSRLETLIHMLGNRKDLLFGLLNHKNVLTNQQTSIRAQQSANKMERLTSHMKDIAIETEEETVSMRIVTYVTLVFLPGTFVSTVMSTPILQYPTGNAVSGRVFSLGALKVWIGMTVALMVVTFVASYLIRRKEAKKSEKRRNMLDFSEYEV